MKSYVYFIIAFALMVIVGTIGAVAQNYKRVGNKFVYEGGSSKAEPEKTEFTVIKQGVEYPVYITANGRCFILKVSKNTGKEYKQYLGEDISRDICKELNREYVDKVASPFKKKDDASK